MPKPTIGRIVSYRSKTGRYTLPAVIAVTVDTIYQPAVEAGFMKPLHADTDVHLVVFTAGLQGARLPDTDPDIRAQAAGGSYQEHQIPYWESPDIEFPDRWTDEEQPMGTWTWLRRV